MTRAWLGVVCLLAMAAGCKEEGEDSADGGGIALTVEVMEIALTLEPWEGVDVCVRDTSECGVTDADGLVTLDVPENSEISVTLEGDETFPAHLVPLTTTDADDAFSLNVSNQAFVDVGLDGMETVLGTPIDPTMGVVVFNARATMGDTTVDVAGVSATIAPDSGTAPVYLNDAGLMGSGTETSDHGSFQIANLPDGTYEMTLSHATRSCVPWLAWPAEDGGTLRFPATGGHITQTTAVCAE